jgi:hypothetical protein
MINKAVAAQWNDYAAQRVIWSVHLLNTLYNKLVFTNTLIFVHLSGKINSDSPNP